MCREVEGRASVYAIELEEDIILLSIAMIEQEEAVEQQREIKLGKTQNFRNWLGEQSDWSIKLIGKKKKKNSEIDCRDYNRN